MKSILLGLTRQYLNAFRTVAAPLWLCVLLLLIGGPWLGQTLMVAASRGELDLEGLPRDELRLVCHLLATLFFGFGTVVGLFQKPTYVFRLPISSRLLATWQFAMTAVTIAVCNGAMTIAYQVLFGATLSYATTLPMITMGHLLTWLVWMFVPATLAERQERAGLLGSSLRRQFAFTLARMAKWLLAVIAFDSYAVFRTVKAEEEIFWQRLTALDVAVLLLMSGLVWKLVANEIERQRHGDVNYRMVIEGESESLLGRFAHQNVPAPGEWQLEAAHRWYHWQSGRTLLLMGTIFVVPLLLMIFLGIHGNHGNRKIESVVAMLTVMPMLVSLLVGAALGLGTVNATGRREMKKHLAVLPVSDRDLSRTMLATFVKTLSGLWGVVFVICAVALALFCAAMGPASALKELQRMKLFQELGFWAAPLQLLVSIQIMWTVGGLTVALAWTGREQFFTKVYLAFVTCALPTFVVIKVFVLETHQEAVFTVILSAMALATVGLIVWSYQRAMQRNLLEPLLPHGAFAAWAAEAGLCLILLPAPLPMRLAAAALIGLGVLPITLGPLAVAWNRHR
ncbi:hypothetical protein GC176_14360 [bacterium]|nr:hypothetical protein [bacterium]